MANYYKPIKITKKYNMLFDNNGQEFNEHNRGLDGTCQEDNKQHDWLLLPITEYDSKQYLVCIKCFEHSHF